MAEILCLKMTVGQDVTGGAHTQCFPSAGTSRLGRPRQLVRKAPSPPGTAVSLSPEVVSSMFPSSRRVKVGGSLCESPVQVTFPPTPGPHEPEGEEGKPGPGSDLVSPPLTDNTDSAAMHGASLSSAWPAPVAPWFVPFSLWC